MSRFILSGPPKQGHRWLRCLLGAIYDLRQLGGGQTPEMTPESFTAWVRAGLFPDNTILHHHTRFSPALCDAFQAGGATIVVPIRDPYDTFVSLYFWAQDRATREPPRAKPRPRSRLVGKAIDDPDVLAFLQSDYGAHLNKAIRWLHSRRGPAVRYEHLHADPMTTLASLTEHIDPVSSERISSAIETCSADSMRSQSAFLSRHVRAATVGDSRAHLTEAHLAIFRDHHSAAIRSLGYDVR